VLIWELESYFFSLCNDIWSKDSVEMVLHPRICSSQVRMSQHDGGVDKRKAAISFYPEAFAKAGAFVVTTIQFDREEEV
jgi:hypothetical protein